MLCKMSSGSILEIAFRCFISAAHGENEDERNIRDQNTAYCVLQTVEMT